MFQTDLRHLLDGVVHIHHANGGAWCCIDWPHYRKGMLYPTTRPLSCFWCLAGILGLRP